MIGGKARRKRARARHQAGCCIGAVQWRPDVSRKAKEAAWLHLYYQGAVMKDVPVDFDWWEIDWTRTSSPSRPNLSAMIAAAESRYEAMSPEERAEHDQAQRESWARAMAPCEHGVADWETCPKCRGWSEG